MTSLTAAASQTSGDESSLDAAMSRLEHATDAIKRGLNRTKREIGKTERRKAAIEHGRDRAITKLTGLLERVEAAGSVDELSDTDQLTLKRLLD